MQQTAFFSPEFGPGKGSRSKMWEFLAWGETVWEQFPPFIGFGHCEIRRIAA
jgi:hypothetical protein